MNLLSNAFKFVPPAGTCAAGCRSRATTGWLSRRRFRPGREAGAAQGDLRALPSGRRRHESAGLAARASASPSRTSSSSCTRAPSRCSIRISAARASRCRCRCARHRRRRSHAAGAEHRASTAARSRAHRGAAPAGAGARRAHRPASRRPEAGTRAKVLVVEDNADMNRFVAQCLRGEYQVVTAFDGQQGLERALAIRRISSSPTS